MAQSKLPPSPNEIFIPQPFALPSELEDAPDDISLLNVLSDLESDSEGVKVNVYRSQSGTKKLAYLFSCQPDEFGLEKLRDEYGGGDFRVIVRKDGLNVANKAVSVEAPKEAPKLDISSSNQLETLVKAMQTGFESILAAVVHSNQPQSTDQVEVRMLEKMAMYKQLFAQQAPVSASDTTDTLGTFLKGIEFMRSMDTNNREATTADVLMETVKTAMPALAAAMTAPKTAPIPAQPVLTSPAQESPIQEQADMFKHYVQHLCNQAARDADTYIWAGLICEQMPEADLRTLIADPLVIDKLSAYDARVLQYRQWFVDLVAEIKNYLTTDEIGASVGENPSGTGTDNAGHS